MVLALACGAPGRAASSPTAGAEGSAGSAYTVVDQDLRTLLIEVADQIGLHVSLTDAVHGRVRGRLPDTEPVKIVDYVANVYGLDHYVHNGTLYVSARSEATTRVLPLGPVRSEDLSAAMANLGLLDADHPLRLAGAGGLAEIAGPPSYLDLVAMVLANLSKRPDAVEKPARTVSVMIFRGSAR